MSFREDWAHMEGTSDAAMCKEMEVDMEWQVPCTAAEDRTCQIADHISVLNRLLWWTGLRLLELSEGDGQLAVVDCQASAYELCLGEERRMALECLAWLLTSHPCVTSLYANKEILQAYHEAVFRGALDANCSLKSLTVDVPSADYFGDVRAIICALPQLDKLEVRSEDLELQVALAISEALSTRMLTVLDISIGKIASESAFNALMTALKANSTLRELSVNDKLFISSCEGREQKFTHYLARESMLDTMSIRVTSTDTLKCVLLGMRNNERMSTLNLLGQFPDDITLCEILRDIFLQNTALSSITMSALDGHFAIPHENGFGVWLEGLAKNKTLKRMKFPFTMIPRDRWHSIFETVSTHTGLEKVVVEVSDSKFDELEWFKTYPRARRLHDALLDVCKSLDSSSAKGKVTFIFKTLQPHNLDATTSDYFSFLIPRGEITSPPMNVIKQLCSFESLKMTELRVDLYVLEGRQLEVAKFIRETTTLRKLRLIDQFLMISDMLSYMIWEPILQSLWENTSIREITVYTKDDTHECFDRLLELVALSKTIRKLNVYRSGPFDSGIFENYSLCNFRMLIDDSEELNWFDWCDTSWRNSGIVARAAHIMNETRWDRWCAIALETVSRHPALMEELAEVLPESEVDIETRVRDRLRDFRDMNAFMQLTGVVKEKVACHPREDGRKQLSDLDEDCRRHLMRYLRVSDIRWASTTANSTALQ